MILIEKDHNCPTRITAGLDADTVIEMAHEAHARGNYIVWESATPREMAGWYCLTPESSPEEFEEEGAIHILNLGTRHGWDTELYRANLYADSAGADEAWGPTPIDELAAAVEALNHDGGNAVVIRDKEQYRFWREYRLLLPGIVTEEELQDAGEFEGWAK